MLTRYHRWIYENYKIESVEVLRECVIQETEFQTKTVETIQGLSRKHDVGSNTREIPYTFFGKQNHGTGSEPSTTKFRICKLCNKSYGIWTCSEFKAMEIPTRQEYAKNRNYALDVLVRAGPPRGGGNWGNLPWAQLCQGPHTHQCYFYHAKCFQPQIATPACSFLLISCIYSLFNHWCTPQFISIISYSSTFPRPPLK